MVCSMVETTNFSNENYNPHDNVYRNTTAVTIIVARFVVGVNKILALVNTRLILYRLSLYLNRRLRLHTTIKRLQIIHLSKKYHLHTSLIWFTTNHIGT